jgi:prepilin-type processing-associated H-X9-DG protein
MPFISCASASAMGQDPKNGIQDSITGKASSSPEDQSANLAHFFNKRFKGVNAAYADGHVESHVPRQMECGYFQGSVFWFY